MFLFQVVTDKTATKYIKEFVKKLPVVESSSDEKENQSVHDISCKFLIIVFIILTKVLYFYNLDSI